MDWGRFLDVHFRPHLVVVNIGSPSDSASGRNLIHQLERLTESLATVANYAMYSDDQVIKVAVIEVTSIRSTTDEKTCVTQEQGRSSALCVIKVAGALELWGRFRL